MMLSNVEKYKVPVTLIISEVWRLQTATEGRDLGVIVSEDLQELSSS